jgi:hypothetical protein
MKTLRAVSTVSAVAALVTLAAACTLAKPTPVAYEKDGIKFTHLSSWKITKDEPIGEAKNARIINVEGPDSALLSIICIPESSSATLESFADDVASRRTAAISDKFRVGSMDMAQVAKGTSENIEQTIAGAKVPGVRQKFSITLLSVLVPHQADFFMLHHGRTKVVLMSQVAEKHLQQAGRNFDAVYESLSLEGLQ